jgi:hypothetical protein
VEGGENLLSPVAPRQRWKAAWDARTNRRLAHPDHSAGEVEGGKEVAGAAVVACGDAPEVFELVEEAFDAVAQLVGDRVMGNLDFAVLLGGG